MESIRVDYHRKVGTSGYGSTAIGGSFEFKPQTDDTQKEFEQAFIHLKLIVDAKVAEEVGQSGGTFDEQVDSSVVPEPPEPPEPDLGPEPEWVGKNQERIDELLGKGTSSEPTIAHPAPPPPPAPPEPVVVQAPDASSVNSAGTATASPTEGNPDGRDIYLDRAKVFRSEMKRSKTGRPYAELRVGHQDLVAHTNDQYITVRVFVPEFAAVVGTLKKMKDEETGAVQDVETLNIVKNDFVNLWGQLSAWKTDPTKYDLTASAIQAIPKQ